MSKSTVIARYSLCPLLGIERADLRAIDTAARRAPDRRYLDGDTGEYVSEWGRLDEPDARTIAARLKALCQPELRVDVNDQDVSDAR